MKLPDPLRTIGKNTRQIFTEENLQPYYRDPHLLGTTTVSAAGAVTVGATAKKIADKVSDRLTLRRTKQAIKQNRPVKNLGIFKKALGKAGKAAAVLVGSTIGGAFGFESYENVIKHWF